MYMSGVSRRNDLPSIRVCCAQHPFLVDRRLSSVRRHELLSPLLVLYRAFREEAPKYQVFSGRLKTCTGEGVAT